MQHAEQQHTRCVPPDFGPGDASPLDDSFETATAEGGGGTAGCRQSASALQPSLVSRLVLAPFWKTESGIMTERGRAEEFARNLKQQLDDFHVAVTRRDVKRGALAAAECVHITRRANRASVSARIAPPCTSSRIASPLFLQQQTHSGQAAHTARNRIIQRLPTHTNRIIQRVPTHATQSTAWHKQGR